MELDQALFCSSIVTRPDECDDLDTLSYANMEIGQALTSINSPFQTIQETGAVNVLFVESSELVNDYETARYVMLATNVCISILIEMCFGANSRVCCFLLLCLFLATEKSSCISWLGHPCAAWGKKWLPTYLF